MNDTAVAAGPALDVMVAEQVMGWTCPMDDSCFNDEPHDGWWFFHGTHSEADFSTTWEGAGLVVERLRELGWDVSMYVYAGMPQPWVKFTKTVGGGRTLMGEKGAPTFPEAVARAALEAINA